MSSKSNARLPAEPLISIRIAFLRPRANRVASNDASAPAGEPAEEDRGVVDGHLAPSPSRRDARQRARRSAGQRPLRHEGLEHPADPGQRSGR